MIIKNQKGFEESFKSLQCVESLKTSAECGGPVAFYLDFSAWWIQIFSPRVAL